MTKSRARDQFLYALLAVVFGAAAVIFLRYGAMPPSQTRTEVLGARTPDELMGELNKTVETNGSADIKQMKQDAGGL